MSNIIKREQYGLTWETIHDYVHAGGQAYEFTAQTVQFHGRDYKPIYLITAPGLAFRTIDVEDAKKILRAHYSGGPVDLYYCPIASTFGATGYRTTKPIYPTVD